MSDSERTTVHHEAKGTVVITRLRPGVLLSIMSGYDDGALTHHNLAAMQEEIDRAGYVCVFADARNLLNAAAPAREKAAAWMKEHRSQFRGLHLLFNSKLIEMGVALVNFVLNGGITSYSNATLFEAAIAREVPGFTHMTTEPAARKIATR